MSEPVEVQKTKEVLQLCHGYSMPFHDVARQYASLFNGTEYKVTTVFLTGKKDLGIAEYVRSHRVIFLENTSKDIRGLKLKQIRQVRELCKEHDFAFCLAHRFKPVYIAAHVSGLHVIGVHHAYGDYERWTRRLFVNRRKKDISFLGVSNAIRDDIRKNLPKFKKSQICTLYNRIDVNKQRTNLISRLEARGKLDIPEDAYVFANVGRLHPDKDQKTLIEAFALIHNELSNAILVIMGKGRLEKVLKEKANSLGIGNKVRFTGPIPNGSAYFKAFDSFVLSSDHEPFGMVLLEAMCAELPMVVCNSGGAPEVCGEAGLMFELGDFDELASCMKKLYTLDKSERVALVHKANQRLISTFTDEQVREQFWQLPALAPYRIK